MLDGKYKPTRMADFKGGLNTKISELNGMKSTDTPDCMDVYSDVDGGLHRRDGRSLLNTNTIGAGTLACNLLFNFTNKGFGVFGTSSYKMDEFDGTWDVLDTGLTDAQWYADNFAGTLVMGNHNYDTTRTWNGTAATTTAVTNTDAFKGRYPKVWESYVWWWNVKNNTSRLGRSEYGSATAYNAINYYDIVTHDGDEGTGIAVLKGIMYCFKRWSIHRISYLGGMPLVNIRQTTSGVGTVSHNTIKNITIPGKGEVLIFFSPDKKLYIFDGYSATSISAKFEENNNICPFSLESVNNGGMKFAHATVDETKHTYNLFLPNGGSSTMTHVLSYNYHTGGVWPYQGQEVSATTVLLDTNGRKHVVVGDYEGHTYTWDNGNIDEIGIDNVAFGADGSVAEPPETKLQSGGGLTNGTHDGGDNLAYAEDSSENFSITHGVAVNDYVLNKTDNCSGIVTSIDAGAGTNARLTMSGGLSGGTDNDFDDDDVFGVYKTAFVADNDSIYIGCSQRFNIIQIDLQVNASATIVPSVLYSSDAAGTYTSLTATDGTTGFTGSGVITFTIPSGWTKTAVDDGNNAFSNTTAYYYIRVQRTADSLTTTPKLARLRVGNNIPGYHTTPRMFQKAPSAMQKPRQVRLDLKAVSDDSVNFQHREDYNRTWSSAEIVPLYNTNDERYLGTATNGFVLNTATLGADKNVVYSVIDLPYVVNFMQFKLADTNITGPWTLYAYDFLSQSVGYAEQQTGGQ